MQLTGSALALLITSAIQLVSNLAQLVKESKGVVNSDDENVVHAALQKLQEANDELFEALQSKLRG